MELNEYQCKAARTSSKTLSRDGHLMNGCLGLAGEAGECCDLLKKNQFQDGREIREKMLDELGDVLWYIAESASALGYTLDEVADHNVKKLMNRYPEGFDAERSLHRENVIRCKDCKFYEQWEIDSTTGTCQAKLTSTSRQGFCDLAERDEA